MFRKCSGYVRGIILNIIKYSSKPFQTLAFLTCYTFARGVFYATVKTEDAYEMPIPLGIFYVL